MRKALVLFFVASSLFVLSGCWPYYHHRGQNPGYHHMNYYNSDGNGSGYIYDR
jgi:hypothetical protein